MTRDLATDKMELTELSNKLFMYTDARQWDRLIEEVFMPEIWIDMSSLAGASPQIMEASALCNMWKDGFEELDAVHHQAGHYLIDVQGNQATIYAYAIASHFRKAASRGPSRQFIGSYDLKAERVANGWRLSQFKYNLKYIDGNIALE